MNFKRLSVSVAAIALFALIVACVLLRPWQESSDSYVDRQPIRIGTLYWPGIYWIDVAREKGWFAEAGLNPQFVDANVDYYEALDKLETNELDTLTVWLYDVVKRNQGGADLVMVLATDVSNGSEALVGASSIESVRELKGARIGVALNSALVYELEAMLSRFGLSLNDVHLIDMEPELAVETLAEGQVDAVMTWEPFVSEAVEIGGRSLYDSSKLPGLIMSGMVFTKGFIDDRPQDIQKLLEVWHRTTGYMQSHQQEAFTIVAAVNNTTLEDVTVFAERNRALDLRENITAFTYASGIESLFGSARKINRFLLNRNEADAQLVDGTDLLDNHFIQQLARDKQSL